MDSGVRTGLGPRTRTFIDTLFCKSKTLILPLFQFIIAPMRWPGSMGPGSGTTRTGRPNRTEESNIRDYFLFLNLRAEPTAFLLLKVVFLRRRVLSSRPWIQASLWASHFSCFRPAETGPEPSESCREQVYLKLEHRALLPGSEESNMLVWKTSFY